MTGVISIVKNPLTIIAMFAGIAEVSGTAVLPLIAEPNQRLYIFFLMFFPTFLVSLFFYTLFKKPESLYAPSDFVDEGNYMAIIGQQGISISSPSNSNSNSNSSSSSSLDVDNSENYNNDSEFKSASEEVVRGGSNVEVEGCSNEVSGDVEDKGAHLHEPEVPYPPKQPSKPNNTSRREMIIKRLGSQVHYMAFLYAEHKLNIKFNLKQTEMRNELGYHNFDGAYYPPISNGKLTGDIVFLEIKIIGEFKYQSVLRQVELINESWVHLKNIRVFFVFVIDNKKSIKNDLLNDEIEIIYKKSKFPMEVDVVTIEELKYNFGKKENVC